MSRGVKAFLLSFLVYLLPIVQVHGGSLLGIVLWAELTGGYGNREGLWLAMDSGLALALQLAAFICFRWIMAGRRWRWLTILVAGPALVAAFNYAWQIEIPKRFLIEAETRPETGNWPVACSIADASTVGLQTGVTLALERAGEVWVRTGKKADYGLLSVADCRIASRELFFPGARGGIGYVTGGGTMYYRLDREGNGVFDHWYFGAGFPGTLKLEAPAAVDFWSPVVASDGGALGWIEFERDGNRKVIASFIVVRVLASGEQRRIRLALEPHASPRLLDFNLAEGVFHVSRNYREILRIGWDGRRRGNPVKPPGFDHLGNNIRLLDDGWVVWDQYRENKRNRVAWSLPAGEGSIEIPLGRGVTALSVDPLGRYIAVSVTRNLSIGDVRDAVFVLRAADGAELYRRYLDAYTRSQVAFLGADRLAVSVIENGAGRIDVLRVPRP